MKVVSLRWSGRFGHFRRAEANREGFTYPIPPRTAILGLLGAIVGLPKDESPERFSKIGVACSGAPPRRFWHRVKLRKDPPPLLSRTIKAKDKGSTHPERATLMNFELMWRPSFRVDIAFPETGELDHALERRLRDEAWYYSPCLGLSEFLARVEFLGVFDGTKLQPGVHGIESCCVENKGCIKPGTDVLSIQLLRMPDSVDRNRNFIHRGYFIEAMGRPIPLETSEAWAVDGRSLVFS